MLVLSRYCLECFFCMKISYKALCCTKNKKSYDFDLVFKKTDFTLKINQIEYYRKMDYIFYSMVLQSN